MKKKINIRESREKLFEMMGKINPDTKQGVPFEAIPEEDQGLFMQVFNNPELRGSHGPDYDGNYINTKEFRNWDEPRGNQYRNDLQVKADAFNKQAPNTQLVFKGFQDWDTDDDRYWDASYSFTFLPK